MLAPDHSMSFCQFPDHNILDSEVVQTTGCSNDIHDGIHSAGLMEVNLLQRTGVNPGFCLADNAEDLLRQSADLRF